MRAIERLALAAALVSAWLVACRGSDIGKDAPGCQDAGKPAQVVDAALLAYLSKARSVHLLADQAEADGHPDEAIAALERLASDPAPGAPNLAPETREVLADTLARLAELKGDKGDFDGAVGDVHRGLSLAQERTHFRGRLFEVLGAVDKRRYERLEQAGDQDGARAAKERSIAALKEAIAIQQEVIDRSLGKP